MARSILQKWWQVYANDEEKRFFVGKDGRSGLIRNAQYQWRSTDSLAKEAGLTKERTEQIIDKYHKAGILIQNAKDPEKWGYWENVAPNAANRRQLTVSEEDHQKRIEKADPKATKQVVVKGTPVTGKKPITGKKKVVTAKP